ncbi:MAG: transcription antitermination factor NusB [Patescibacteria group bacterium]
MKLKSDPRHIARVAAVKSLFATSFQSSRQVKKSLLARQALTNRTKIDRLLKKYAPAWPIGQIAPIDLAILRLAIYELLFKTEKEPYKVVIDEAIEVAKEFGSARSASFINGVLGSIIKSEVESQDDS